MLKLREYKDGTKEETFLEKVKSTLSGDGSVAELVSLVLRTGKDVSLTLEQITKIFS